MHKFYSAVAILAVVVAGYSWYEYAGHANVQAQEVVEGTHASSLQTASKDASAINRVGPFKSGKGGTYIDANTNLMWQGSEGGNFDYMGALAYCDNLKLAGHKDWRLPTIKEWESVMDYTRYDPATTLPGTVGDAWSSTVLPHDTGWALVALVYDGYIGSESKEQMRIARCVRAK